MARDLTDHTPITHINTLIDYSASGEKPKEAWKIGTEHEKFPFFVASHAPVPYHGTHGIEALLTGMKGLLDWQPIMDGEHIIGLFDPIGKAAISLEPGGQFELSGAPLDTLHHTKDELKSHFNALNIIAKPMGIAFLGMGGSPKWTLSETPQMPKSRYKIMTDYMPKVGTRGLNMMYQTSTVQVNLDFASEDDMRRKMRLSLTLQAIATALFASSPFSDGAPNGLQSWRAHIWLDTDNHRSGIPAQFFHDSFGYADYVEWALDVPMYFVLRDGVYHPTHHVTFRQFMNGALKGKLTAYEPTLGDWTNHLGTLFPDVRLKRYLEMRGADSGPLSHITALPAFWVGLLYDDATLCALEALTRDWSFEDVVSLRASVPQTGLKTSFKNTDVLAIAREVLALSSAGLRARGQGEEIFLEPLFEIVGSEKTLSDVMLYRYTHEWNQNIEPVFDAYQYPQP